MQWGRKHAGETVVRKASCSGTSPLQSGPCFGANCLCSVASYDVDPHLAMFLIRIPPSGPWSG